MKQNDFILIGKISGVHGVKGLLKVYSYADADIFFEPGQSVLIRHDGGKEQYCIIESSAPFKKGFLISFKGVCDRNSAEAYVQSRLYIDRRRFPEPEEGEYYWADLIGLAVYEDDRYLGRIDSILETGSNDVYIVKDGEKEILIPALESVLVSVDIENGTMRVNLPEGL